MNSMKIIIPVLGFFLTALPLVSESGSLDPTEPPSSTGEGTMHSLEEIYNKIVDLQQNGSTGKAGAIQSAVKEYYLAHRDIPEPEASFPIVSMFPDFVYMGEVPAADLGVNPDVAVDAWGNNFEYHMAKYDNGPIVDPDDPYMQPRPILNMISVDGVRAAGVIISYGANGMPDHLVETGAAASPGFASYSTSGDDILTPIVVTMEAISFARKDLALLQDRALAFDKMYQGVDNNGDGLVDCVDANANGVCDPGEEGLCVAQTPTGDSPGSCPPTGADNDPNCGFATLDYYNPMISPPPFYSCSVVIPEAAGFIIEKYSLPKRLLIDPWGWIVRWGAPGMTPEGTTISPGNPGYHTFYSLGPDYSIESDDIFP